MSVIADGAVAGSRPSVRWALASLSLSMLLSSLGISIANVALPTLAQAFRASFQAAQWVVLAYLLAITTLIVSVGRLGDIIGRRRLLLAGILLFTVASILCGTAPSVSLLIAGRTAQGLGAAIMMALAMAFVGAGGGVSRICCHRSPLRTGLASTRRILCESFVQQASNCALPVGSVRAHADNS